MKHWLILFIIFQLPLYSFCMNNSSSEKGFKKTNLSFIENPSDKDSSDSKEIKLIMRADDIGFSHAANLAIIKGYKEGTITSTEVMPVCPWFLEAAELLNENPGLDVGIHLALTSEWKNYKWGPITMAKSLVTEDGYFAANSEELNKLTPNLVEVENELRAQIKLALKYIPQVSHLSFHMNTVSSTPELLAIGEKLSREFNLPLENFGINSSYELWGVPIEEKEGYLINALNNLKPGINLIVFHLSLNNSESQAIGTTGDDADLRMALHRETELNLVISSKIKQIIKKREIKLISYTGKEKFIR